MTTKQATASIACFIAVFSFGLSAETSPVRVLKGSGGSIKTPLSSTIVLNDKSTLQREWIAISDKALPVSFAALTGVTTRYKDEGRYSGKYLYSATYSVTCAEPITALEVRFIVFDVWGKTIKSLVAEDVADLAAGNHNLSSTWNIFSENEASSYYASIAYVARVRTKTGKVIEANPKPVLEQARIFNAKFDASELEPEKPSKK